MAKLEMSSQQVAAAAQVEKRDPNGRKCRRRLQNQQRI